MRRRRDRHGGGRAPGAATCGARTERSAPRGGESYSRIFAGTALASQDRAGSRRDPWSETARGLERREGPRAVIVPVITDGTEFSNRHQRDVLDALRRSGAALHALTIGTFPTSMADPIRTRAIVLDEGPRATGGQRMTLLTSMAAEKALEKLSRELLNQHKVVYGRPESLIQPEAVTVSVTRPGLTARGTAERRKPGA